MAYPIPSEQAIAEIEIKKSRFIAYAKGLQSREEGMQWLQSLRETYPDARHHCWAYLLGNPGCATNAGMGDDGEPSGTAGKPILNVLHHKGVADVMVVVVRYFGGIKLGAGGLTRAYGQAAQAVMEILPTEQQIEMEKLNLVCDFSQEQQVRYFLDIADGNILNVDYQQRVKISISVPVSQIEALQQFLNSMSIKLIAQTNLS